jgi:hypothetical protein
VFGVAVVACAVLAVPASAEPSAPTGLSATVRNDHRVDLSWSWPSAPTYPDELQVWRNGTEVAEVPVTSVFFSDTPPSAGTTYSYQLVTVNAGVGTPVASVSATTRADAPNAPTGIKATFAAGTNLATVTFTRGDADSDVTYDVVAQQPGGGVVSSQTARYSTVGTAGQVTMGGFASYTSYVFSVEAIEDAGDPPSDPGQTTVGANPPNDPEQSNDTSAPSFNGGLLIASRTSLGTITAIWPAASDSGTGVASYLVCFDGSSCQTVPFDPLAPSQQAVDENVADDGAVHSVVVTALDGAGNVSSSISTTVIMNTLAAPTISFPGSHNGDGCGPLVPKLSSTDGPQAGLTFQLLVNAQPVASGEVQGAPYDTVTLSAVARFGTETSAPVSPISGQHVYDPDPPADAPVVSGTKDAAGHSEQITWSPITAVGAPVIGYQVVGGVPGFAPPGGKIVSQSAQPGQTITNLDLQTIYSVDVHAIDACGRLSPETHPFTFQLDDQTAPSAPVASASLTGNGTSVHLSWAPSSDDVQVQEYRVYRNGELVWTTPALSFDNAGLDDASTYTYTVVAYDTSSNPSSPSPPVLVTTRDLTPPSQSGNPHIVGVPSAGTITLAWGAAIDNVGVTGYRVRRDGQIVGTPVDTGFTDRNVPAGSHVWAVTALDAAGNESVSRQFTYVMTGPAIATKASSVKPAGSRGAKGAHVGGKAGVRLVLVFKLAQTVNPAELDVRVLSGSARLRVSLPSGTGRTTAGRRLAERPAKKGLVRLAIGKMPAGTIRLILTSSHGGVLTLAGRGGSKAPVIVTRR